jgi:hypothetical protein
MIKENLVKIEIPNQQKVENVGVPYDRASGAAAACVKKANVLDLVIDPRDCSSFRARGTRCQTAMLSPTFPVSFSNQQRDLSNKNSAPSPSPSPHIHRYASY